jgi:hypothetical protein
VASLLGNAFFFVPQALMDKLATRKKQQDDDLQLPPVPYSRLARLNRPEWSYWLLGLACAVVAGLQVR